MHLQKPIHHQRYFSFAGGPTMMPHSIFDYLHSNFLKDQRFGVSLLDISPHSKQFKQIHHQAQTLVRDLLHVPQDHHIWFTQAGAHLQFGAFPLNLMNGKKTANYTATGYFSKLALEEAAKVIPVKNIADMKRDEEGKLYIPDHYEYDENAAYTHYVDNQTVEGMEYNEYNMPWEEGRLLLTDCSSNFLTRHINWKKTSLAYAHTQKNCGISGSTIMILHQSLINQPKLHQCPLVCDYRQYQNRGYPSTPIVIPIYVNYLMLKYAKDSGGVEHWQQNCTRRSKKLYDIIDASHGYYNGVARKDWRSRINVTWRMGSEEMQNLCMAEAAKVGLLEIKGHRTAGGFRASLFVQVPDEGVDKLADFLQDFMYKHQ